MTAVVDALARALRDLFNLRVLWVVVWPMLVALLLWLALGVTFWGTFSGWIAQGLDAIGIQVWLADLEPRWIANGIQALLHLMLFVPLVMLTALVITALFGDGVVTEQALVQPGGGNEGHDHPDADQPQRQRHQPQGNKQHDGDR
ncbi:MAG TPA: EI24 domain-containing protein, partial [Thiobacillus sp.]|nr:EI24 domain-containing protein [Thiobacillus sp.]